MLLFPSYPIHKTISTIPIHNCDQPPHISATPRPIYGPVTYEGTHNSSACEISFLLRFSCSFRPLQFNHLHHTRLTRHHRLLPSSLTVPTAMNSTSEELDNVQQALELAGPLFHLIKVTNKPPSSPLLIQGLISFFFSLPAYTSS